MFQDGGFPDPLNSTTRDPNASVDYFFVKLLDLIYFDCTGKNISFHCLKEKLKFKRKQQRKNIQN